MQYQIGESEFKTALKTVGRIGNNVNHSIVSQYQDDVEEYDPSSFNTKEIWESFLSYELRHLLARIGFRNLLAEKYDIKSRVRGIDEEIDWVSFHNPWNQRLSLKSDSLEYQFCIKGLQPHYKWVTTTERQYRRFTSDSLVGAASVSFRDWGNKNELIHPDGFVTTHHVGNKQIEEKPDNINEIREELNKTEDYGNSTVYKFNKELDWIASFNSPVKVNILGVSNINNFDSTNKKSPDKFAADYFLNTSDLENICNYLP